jgi:hypothetical protein
MCWVGAVKAIALLLPVLAACTSPRRGVDALLPPRDAFPALQALVGVNLLDPGELVLEDVDDGDPGAFAVAEYSAMPSVGVAGMQPLTHDPLHVGLEGTLFFSWWVDEAETFASGDVDVDTRLLITDLGIGPYVSTSMGRNVRAYAGAGAAFLFAALDVESDAAEDDPDSWSFGVGGYARAGLELRLGDGSLLGLGVRGVAADLDFDGDHPDAAADGLQVFLTYTTGADPYFAPPDWD